MQDENGDFLYQKPDWIKQIEQMICSTQSIRPKRAWQVLQDVLNDDSDNVRRAWVLRILENSALRYPENTDVFRRALNTQLGITEPQPARPAPEPASSTNAFFEQRQGQWSRKVKPVANLPTAGIYWPSL